MQTTSREAEAFVTFGELFRDRTSVQVGHRLTTEFLLSGDLPGQRQGERAAYLSSYHWNETLNRVDKLERELRHSDPVRIPHLSELQELSDPRELLESASHLIPEGILEVLKRAEAVNRRLKRCFSVDEPALRPVELSRYWESAEARVRTRDVSKWRATLTRLRQIPGASARGRHIASGRRAEDGSREKARVQIEQDAATLAGIEALYRENPEACGDARELCFLFVTADRAILDAVAEKRETLAAEGIPLFARHPRVYSPILNFSNMMRARSSDVELPDSIRDVFMEVEQAIEQLFEVDNSAATIAQISRSEPLRDSIKHWEDAARQLVTVNAKFFAEDDEDIQAVAERLSRPDALKEASLMLRETITGIRNDHTRLLSDQALSNLSRNLQELTIGSAAQGVRRAPVKIVGVNLVPHGAWLTRTESTQNLDELLDTLLADKNVAQISGTITVLRKHLHRDWETSSGQLLASCVYLAIGAWQSARDCAERCKRLVKGPSNRSIIWREGNYAKALALRFGIRFRSELDEAVDSLRKNITDWALQRDASTGGRIAPLRDKIEYAALLQAVAVLQAIENNTPFSAYGPDELPLEILDREEIPSYFDQSVVAMEEAAEILDLDYSGQTEMPYLVDQLRRQLFLNLVGAHVFRRLLGQSLSSEPLALGDLENALDRLEEVLNGSVRPVPAIGQVYQACGRLLTNSSSTSEAGTVALIAKVLSDELLPYADLVELRYLRDYFLKPSEGAS